MPEDHRQRSATPAHPPRAAISARFAGLCASVPWLAACRGPQSALDPAGPSAEAIARIWWVMFAGASTLALLVFALLGYALFRRGRGPQLSHPHRLIASGGLAMPIVVLTALLVYGLIESRHVTGMDDPVDGIVEVVGHRWFWEFRHLDAEGAVVARTIDRLTLPRGRTIEFRVTSADVIHSFWIPRLGGKIDAIPGRVNRMRLRADGSGAIRGQCAEFCGRDHAHMTFEVAVLDLDDYRRWLAEDDDVAASDDDAQARDREAGT